MGDVSPKGSRSSTGSGRGSAELQQPLPPPKSKEEWDDFITRYTIGEFHQENFAGHDGDAPKRNASTPSPPINELVQHLHQTGIDNRFSFSAASSGSHPTSTILTDPTIVPRPSLTGTEANESEFEDFHPDYHPDTSTAGPSNQDPSIPNIAPRDQTDRKPDRGKGEKEKRKMFKNGSKGQSKRDQDDHRITAEHLKRLNKDQDEARADADVEDGGERRQRGSRDGRRRRPPQQAELASANPQASQLSSDEDIPNKSSTRGPTRRSPTRQDTRSNLSYRSVRSRSPVESVTRSILTQPLDSLLLESGTGTTSSVASHADLSYDHGAERQRIREFYEIHGFMPAPKQTPDAMRRRLRVIRRLGLERPDEYHRQALNRFTRLAVSIFKTKVALVSVIGKDRQIFLSEIGFGRDSTDFEVAFCCHTIIGSGEQCLIVPDAANDWRFRNNPLTEGGKGPVQFYAGAPLRIGKGPKAAIIGSMCIIDDKPRTFDEAQRLLLMDLAECVVSELELLYSQQASIESAKLHQISVDFLRRSLKTRPTERAGFSRSSGQTRTTSSGSSSSQKRKEGADHHQSDEEIDIYDEAAREIRQGLDAYAVAVVDLSQFHLFYPSFQNSSTGGSSARGASTSGPTRSGSRSAERSAAGSGTPHSFRPGSRPNSMAETMMTDDTDSYAQSNNARRAKETYTVSDPLAPSRTPQVLFIPSRPRGTKAPQDPAQDNLSVLGYSCAHDNFAFNFTSSPAARKIISDFIASNVKTRRVWYTRDDSEGVAQSITHLMPPGTETSMAMPVFGFDGQVAFAVVACWTDPLYTYPAGAMQFVETIAGSLLASVMKEKLHQAERAQLNFAAAASHELRTPLHQINAAASLLRHSLHAAMDQPGGEMPVELASSTVRKPPSPAPVSVSLEDRVEALAQLEIIEANGLALGHILENIIDTLDIGRLSARFEAQVNPDPGAAVPPKPKGRTQDLALVIEDVVKDAVDLETKSRNAAGVKGMEDVEVILEVLPRVRGQWLMLDDKGPLARALGKIIHNACKFTDKGYVHVTVQDASRDVVLAAGFNNSVRLSTVMIDIKDSGRGMTADFLEGEVLRPFTKADPFMPGSGLGLGLAQRMIEILGGKLAISSTIDKGTLVHVEIPLHLINDDNDSDQEEIEEPANADLGHRPRIPVRQDGIFLAGFERGDLGTRRLGRSLLRQLKLHFCRVVDKIHFASLIVLPEGVLPEKEIAELVSKARPDVELIYLVPASYAASAPSTSATANATATATADGSCPSTDDGGAGGGGALPGVRATRLLRPIGPTAVARIMRPLETQQSQEAEHFVSPIVGGEGARWNDGGGSGGGSGGASGKGSGSGPGSGGTGHTRTGSAARAAARAYARRGSAAGLPDEGDELIPSPPRSPTFRPLDSISSPEVSPEVLDTVHHPEGSLSPTSVKPRSPSAATTAMTTPTTSSSTSTTESHSLRSRSRPDLRVAASEPLTAVLSDRSESDNQERPSPRPGMKEHRSEIMTESDAEKESGPLRVLIVEDNAINRKILTTMLKRVACHYAEAVDGADAVIIFDAFQPDLVLLDINMPVKDGFQAAIEMREIEHNQRRKRARVIAVTALSGEAHRRKGIEASIDSWLVKPVGVKQLKDEVEKMITRDEEGDEAR